MSMCTEPSIELEDDSFYSELRKQILLLTEDDEEDFLETKNRNSGNVMRQGSNGTIMAGFPANYFNWWEKDNSGSIPTWLSNLWRNSSNGTGVFIPHIVKSRRKQKSGRTNMERGRKCKPVENKKL
ncbi:hypothetical protein L1049_005581 [Liquidambar formosana]|uniref:Uncharacterized protein n=1 Tax=Liquidambar formosana TaxID=63359 RepID=A0AAP0RFJ9_LIQFO